MTRYPRTVERRRNLINELRRISTNGQIRHHTTHDLYRELNYPCSHSSLVVDLRILDDEGEIHWHRTLGRARDGVITLK